MHNDTNSGVEIYISEDVYCTLLLWGFKFARFEKSQNKRQ